MTLDELKQESFFQQLGEGQQKFVIAQCSGADRKTAAKTAWACTTDASATSMAVRAMKNANVKFLIAKFFGKTAAHTVPSQSELAAWNWAKAQSCEDPALAIKFASNVADILGYKVRPMDPTIKPPADDGAEEFDL